MKSIEKSKEICMQMEPLNSLKDVLLQLVQTVLLRD